MTPCGCLGRSGADLHLGPVRTTKSKCEPLRDRIYVSATRSSRAINWGQHKYDGRCVRAELGLTALRYPYMSNVCHLSEVGVQCVCVCSRSVH